MNEIRIGEGFEKRLLEAGMIKEIHIPDERVATILRSWGFTEQMSPVLTAAEQKYFWQSKEKIEEGGHNFVRFVGGVRAIADKIEIEEHKGGELAVKVYYKIIGLAGTLDLKPIEELLNVKPVVVRLFCK